MDELLLKELLEKHKAGTCTDEELVLLETWYLQWNPNADMPVSRPLIKKSVKRVWDRLQEDVQEGVIIRLWPRMAAAAAVLIFIGTGTYFYFAAKKSPGSAEIAAQISPGGNKATLTLSNGSKISLADQLKGTVTKQPGVAITKSADGKLTYVNDDKQEKAATQEVAYNTINTPNGGQYQVVLPDGSQVWLNAASSIRYPTIFNGRERHVEITGEVYFEVAKNPKLPFTVNVNHKDEITVLGTHFNVNAYADEPFIQTTLAEGSIKLISGNLSAILKPGQEAQTGNLGNGSPFLKKAGIANLDQVLAWKDGLFNFSDMSFSEAMRQLSRWYNVKVVYEDAVPDVKFGGEMGRDVSFSSVLFFLNKINIHYRLEPGNRLVITK